MYIYLYNPIFQAKDAESEIKDDYKSCKTAFIRCSKLEDEALEYMVKCYTSPHLMKKNLKELLQIKDSCEKLQENLEAKIITTTKLERTVINQKNTDSVTCSTYLEKVAELSEVSFFPLVLEIIKQNY